MRTGTYNSVLTAVPYGATRPGDIAEAADVSESTARRYLKVMAERGEVIQVGPPDLTYFRARPPAVQQCAARLWHGPGHQSSTQCELPSAHDGPHRCIYGSLRQEATWRTGVYTARLRAQGVKFNPASYPEDMGMTGYFDEPPEEDDA